MMIFFMGVKMSDSDKKIGEEFYGAWCPRCLRPMEILPGTTRCDVCGNFLKIGIRMVFVENFLGSAKIKILD